MDAPLSQLPDAGFAILPNVVPPDLIARLIDASEPLLAEREHANRGGVRNLFEVMPLARELAMHQRVRAIVTAVLGADVFAVRGILFDKTGDRNWKVAWHQDVTIAVRERRNVPGFGPWSIKAGVHHVQPPVAVLEAMLAVRVHLDDCGPEQGPLRVLPGSHRHGLLSSSAIERWRAEKPAAECHVPQGGLLIMRPLLLHASSEATSPSHRRVIHIEYAAGPLPGGLAWHERS